MKYIDIILKNPDMMMKLKKKFEKILEEKK